MLFPSNYFKAFIIFLFSSGIIYAQTKEKIDSLYKALSSEKSDTSKCIILADLSNYLSQTLHDSALSLASKCYEIAKENNYKTGKGKALFCMALVKQSQAKYDDGLNYLKQAEAFFTEANRKKELASTYNTMGLGYLAKNDFAGAIESFIKAVKTYEEAKDIRGQAIANGNIGLVYYDETNFDKAFEYFTLAKNLDQSINNEAGVARHTGNIGNIYYRKGKLLMEKGEVNAARELFNKAYIFYNETFQIDENRNNKSAMAMQIGNMANFLNSLG